MTLDKLWEQVKALPPGDQQRLREMLAGVPAIDPTSEMEDEFERELAAEGLIALPERAAVPEPAPDFRPIQVMGRPVSQTIIEERR